MTEKKAGCTVTTDKSDTTEGEVGVVHTEPLTATTTGQGDSIKITPKTGTTFARFWLTGCTPAGINGTYTVLGSLTCKPDGATVICNHNEVTAAKTLRLNSAVGPVAGIAGFLTTSGKVSGGGTYTPLNATTVETP